MSATHRHDEPVPPRPMESALSISRGHNRNPSATKLRWCTPPGLYGFENQRVGGFGLDAAAEPTTALCESYLSPARFDCLTTPWAARCQRNRHGKLWAWFNPPWGPRHTACPFGCASKVCIKRGWHHLDTFVGTGAFTRRAIVQAETLTGVVVLVPTAPDTSWWRELFTASTDVRLLPRIAFCDADTGIAAASPPGGGCTLFELRHGSPLSARRVHLADEFGRDSHEQGTSG